MTSTETNPTPSETPPPEDQTQLFKSKRFLPFFLTQFFGAFNDNVYKNSLILMITYSLFTASNLSGSVNTWTNIAAMLFILPFFLFSATAGQIADKYDKSRVMRHIKMLEVIIMLTAALAFYLDSFLMLIGVLFMMGTQSAFFGPVKYSIIPEHLHEHELVGGNALIEMGTFLAILFGFIGANALIQAPNAPLVISIVIIFLAGMGYLSSRQIPPAPSKQPNLEIEWNVIKQIKRIMGYARSDDAVFHSIIGISWFWFLGAAYLTQLPNFTREVLSSSSDVVTLLLCAFSIGIGLGSLLCEKMSGHKIEIGIVPLGSLGLTLFGADLFLSSQLPPSDSLRTLGQFLAEPMAWRVILDLIFIGIFGGFYIVPLFALIQIRTEDSTRAQVISANNIMNALFMVASAISGALLLGVAKLELEQFFLWLAVVNGVIACYIFYKVPVFATRFMIWLLSHTLYRVTAKGLDKIPDEGAAVIVCNHISYVDALILGGACRRPIRFIMFKPIYELPVLHFIFKIGRTIPIISKKQDPEAYQQAFAEIKAGLEAGDLLCIFPEGRLTKDGEIDAFRPGIERIIEQVPVPVIPVALQGLWGSLFSRKPGSLFSNLHKKWRAKVNIVVGDAVPPEAATAADLEERVKALRGDYQ